VQGSERGIDGTSLLAAHHARLQARQMEEAEIQFKKAMWLDRQYAEAQKHLGVLLCEQGKSTEAEQLFRQAVENNPQYAQAFVNLGLILASQSRFAEAGQALQKRLAP